MDLEAGLLLEANPNDLKEVKEILSAIRKDDVRASEVIRHIRSLLRKRKLEMQPLDINQLAEGVLRLVHAEAHQRNISVQAQFTPQLPVVNGDRVHIQQVLLNLSLNAMDAMAETPNEQRRLRITSAPHPSGGVQISVRDLGRGIPQERFPRLFESFYTTKSEGLGLGLSISRAIIEAHRGRIWAENNADGGATFHFVLPPCTQATTKS